MQVLVLGGSRFMGRFTVQALLADGHTVTCLNRGTMAGVPGIATVVGDRNDPGTWLALKTHDFDAVIDMSAYTPDQSRMALDALKGIPRFVHLSTGAVYRPSPILPWRESHELGPWALWGSYAQNKLDCEEAILRWQQSRGEGEAVIIRVAMVLGPLNYVDREEFIFNRILDGQEILIPGDGEALFSVVSARQVGRSLAKAATKHLQKSKTVVNIGSTLMASGSGLVELCGDLLSLKPQVRLVGKSPIGNSEPIFDPGNCVFPFPNTNYVLDVSKSASLGLHPPEEQLQDWLSEALQALLADPKRRQWQRTQAEQSLLDI